MDMILLNLTRQIGVNISHVERMQKVTKERILEAENIIKHHIEIIKEIKNSSPDRYVFNREVLE